MSRYMGKSKCGRYAYAWGYDRPLREVFFHKYDKKAEDEDRNVIFSIANQNTLNPHPDTPEKMKYSNEEIIDVMEKEMGDHGVEIPYQHRMSIAFNWTF